MKRHVSASESWLLLLVSTAIFFAAPSAAAQATKGGATLQGGAVEPTQPLDPPAPSSYEGTILELPARHNIRQQCRLRYFIRLTNGHDILLLTKPDPHSPERDDLAQFSHRVVTLEGYYVPERPQGSDLQMMQSPLVPSNPKNPCGLAVIDFVRIVR